MDCNRDVKVNVNWDEEQWPSLWGAGFMRQARAGQRFLWNAMNRSPWEPTVCLSLHFFILTLRQNSLRYTEWVNTWQGYCTSRIAAAGLFYLWHSELRWSSVLRQSVISRAAGGPEVWAGHLTPPGKKNKTCFQGRLEWYLPCVTLECASLL